MSTRSATRSVIEQAVKTANGNNAAARRIIAQGGYLLDRHNRATFDEVIASYSAKPVEELEAAE